MTFLQKDEIFLLKEMPREFKKRSTNIIFVSFSELYNKCCKYYSSLDPNCILFTPMSIGNISAIKGLYPRYKANSLLSILYVA